MSDVLKFPERGVIRDEGGEIIGLYHGYTKEEAEAIKARNETVVRAMPMAQKMAEEMGYESLFDMPDEERFSVVDEAVKRISPANDQHEGDE